MKTIRVLSSLLFAILLSACVNNQSVVSSATINSTKVQDVSLKDGMLFFKGTFEQAIVEAKRTNKLLFIDFYTEWCGPCKTMAKTVFVQESVGDVYNKYFINYKLDAEDENVNGPELAKKYQVESFPTYIFVDGNGKLISKKSGSMSADSFKIVGLEVSGADTKDFCKDYENGSRSIDIFVLCFSKKQNDALKIDPNDPSINRVYGSLNEMYKEFYIKLSKEQILTDDGFRMITSQPFMVRAKMFDDMYIEPTTFLFDNIEGFLKVVKNKQIFASKIVDINDTSISATAIKGMHEKSAIYLEDIKGKLAKVYQLAGYDPEKVYQEFVRDSKK